MLNKDIVVRETSRGYYLHASSAVYTLCDAGMQVQARANPNKGRILHLRTVYAGLLCMR